MKYFFSSCSIYFLGFMWYDNEMWSFFGFTAFVVMANVALFITIR